jgi:hypothetical protein
MRQSDALYARFSLPEKRLRPEWCHRFCAIVEIDLITSFTAFLDQT